VYTQGDFQGFFLCPAHYNSRKRQSWASIMDLADDERESRDVRWRASLLGKYAYTSAQIEHYRHQFTVLQAEAGGFLHSLAEQFSGKDEASAESSPVST
jgi:hypothetical protein